MADRDGLAGAIAPMIEAAEPPASIEEQLTLDALADLPVLGEIIREGKAIARPGRPPGARNKRTEEWASYILARYRSPLIGLAEIVATPIPELAKALKCSTIDAATFWRQCSDSLAPYLHQRMPQAIELPGATAGQILVVNFNAPRPGEGGPLSPHGIDLELAKSPNEINDGDPPSHGSPPHEEGK